MESVAKALPQIQALNNTLLQTIQQKTKEINEAKAALVAQLRPTFKELFVPVFDKWPQIQKFEWAQYTPYFNDGEECVFSVNGLCATTNAGEDADDEDSDSSLPVYEFYLTEHGTDKEKDWQKKKVDSLIATFGSFEAVKGVNGDVESLRKSFSEISEDVMQDLFGNHAKVTVTRQGMDVEEYDHE